MPLVRILSMVPLQKMVRRARGRWALAIQNVQALLGLRHQSYNVG